MQSSQSLTRGQKITLLFSSVFGLGYLPWAPGTWGTLGGLLVWWALAACSWPTFTLWVVLLTVGAIWVSGKAEKTYGDHDVQHIVIDEVVGLLATVIGVPFAWPQIVAAFILFRVLDALKPPPICYFDKYVKGGLGVVIDDTVAGLIGCAMLHGARYALGGWW